MYMYIVNNPSTFRTNDPNNIKYIYKLWISSIIVKTVSRFSVENPDVKTSDRRLAILSEIFLISPCKYLE